ncbi:MAG: sensor histidine kinase [Monoglobaceae bacterium]
MEHLLLIISGILFLIIFALLAKVYFLHKSAQEIRDAFRDRLTADTNTLIDISTRDLYMRKLAADINVQLRLLRKERHRYQQGDMELKEAVTNISHDLRTPLTAINGYLDLLEREEKSETVQRYLSQIQNRTEVLKNLTEELFRYSVVISSVTDMQVEQVNLNGVLEESIASFYVALTERGITPTINIPEKRIIRNLNKTAMLRVFSNLLNNAIKYSDGDLAISLLESGEVIFTNTATGLNEIQVGKLFDRFFSVEAARNSTGLGLAISKALVEQMNGTISAQYKDNRLSIHITFLSDKGRNKNRR